MVRIGGRVAIMGVLYDSDSKPGDPCTPVDGEQTWTRVGPQLNVVEKATGRCPVHSVEDGVLADCRGTKVDCE